MILLALDTAGAACAAALYDMDARRIIASRTEVMERGHAERLMPMLDEILAEAGLDFADLSKLAVCIGPGSFTGIRVGVAAARGFALALSIPVVGITTLDVAAQDLLVQGDDRPVLVALDARREEAFVQLFDAKGNALGEAEVMAKDKLTERAVALQARLAGSALAEAGADREPQSIAVLAALGAARTAGDHKVAPLYLRAPDAKPQIGFALARA